MWEVSDSLILLRAFADTVSDLHTYRGIEPSPPGPIMGHEFMGEIVEIGNAVKTLQKGDRVVSAFTTSWCVLVYLLWSMFLV